MCWSWKSLSCWHCWLPRFHFGRVCWTPHRCPYLSLSHLSWNFKFQRVFHFGRMWWSWNGYCNCYCEWFKRIFHFGRVYWSCNEQCCHVRCCHFVELEFGHMVGRRGMSYWIIISFSSLNFPKVLNTYARGCLWQLYWYQQVWIQWVDGPFGRWCFFATCSWHVSDTGHRVALKPGLFPWLEGAPQWNQCLCNVRVIGSISNTFDDKLQYNNLGIFHFGSVWWFWNEKLRNGYCCYCDLL